MCCANVDFPFSQPTLQQYHKISFSHNHSANSLICSSSSDNLVYTEFSLESCMKSQISCILSRTPSLQRNSVQSADALYQLFPSSSVLSADALYQLLPSSCSAPRMPSLCRNSIQMLCTGCSRAPVSLMLSVSQHCPTW